MPLVYKDFLPLFRIMNHEKTDLAGVFCMGNAPAWEIPPRMGNAPAWEMLLDQAG